MTDHAAVVRAVDDAFAKGDISNLVAALDTNAAAKLVGEEWDSTMGDHRTHFFRCPLLALTRARP